MSPIFKADRAAKRQETGLQSIPAIIAEVLESVVAVISYPQVRAEMRRLRECREISFPVKMCQAKSNIRKLNYKDIQDVVWLIKKLFNITKFVRLMSL